MPTFQSADVFIEEVPQAQAPVGVSASEMGVCGFTQRGPINTPIKVNSLTQYNQTFGPNITTSLVPMTVEQFFTNGGQTAIVSRVVPINSVLGQVVVDSPAKYTFVAKSPGDWANTFRVEVAGNMSFLDETVGAERWLGFDVGVQEPDSTGTYLDDEFFENIQFTNSIASNYITRIMNDPDTGSQYVTVVEGTTGTPAGFAVQSISAEIVGYGDGVTRRFRGVFSGLTYAGPALSLSPVAAGNVNDGLHQYRVTALDAAGNETVLSRISQITVVDNTTSGQVALAAIPVGPTGTVSRNIYRTTAGDVDFLLLANIADNTTVVYADNTADTGLTVELPASAQIDPGLILRNTGGATKVTITHNAISITDDGFGNLTAVSGLDPAGNNRVDYENATYDYTLLVAPAIAANGTAVYKRLPAVVDFNLAGGTNGVGVITRNDISNPSLQPTLEGMFAFEKLLDVVNLVLPDFAGDVTVSRDQADYANSRRDRFAILSVPQGQTVSEDLVFVTNQLARTTKRAAVYAPWIKWKNSITNAIDVVPPLGMIAGIYARTDSTRNVGKAPAGKVDGAVSGSSGPEILFSVADRDRLYPRKVNPIVSSTPTGYAVWGDRTLSDDPAWIYINVVRLFMFLEEFVYQRLYFALFENNGPDLWSKIRHTLDGDFSSFFNQKYFAGATKSDAYFITCDQTNNTPADVQAGIVYVDIGVAPNIPAQFIVVRFQQKTATQI